MTTKLKLTATAAALAMLAATGVQADTWRYATEEAAATDVQNAFAQKFKEEIEANTDHEIQLFPFGTLGESDDIMEQAKAGVLQFVTQSPGFTGATIPEAQVFFVPYLLPQDPDQLVEFFRTSTAINEMFPALYSEQGLELLSMYPEGEVCMTTQEEVRSPEDLNEVKFRTMTNPLLVQSYQAFGATPTPLPWGEVYGALQTGIIQGQENPGFFLESTKIYEVTDVITCIGHNNFTTAVMANKDVLRRAFGGGSAGGHQCDRGLLRFHRRLPAGASGRRDGQHPRRQARHGDQRAVRRGARAVPGGGRECRGRVHRDDRRGRAGHSRPDEGRSRGGAIIAVAIGTAMCPGRTSGPGFAGLDGRIR